MKTALRFSILLNVFLGGSMIFVVSNRRQKESAPAPVSSKAKMPVQPAALPVTSTAASRSSLEPFRWSQLESTKNYRRYIANLRAIGCPEATIEDIVHGDTDRAFSWERHQLGLDGSGTGPWSRTRERQLIASLLGGQPMTKAGALAQATEPQLKHNNGEVAEMSAPSQNAGAGAPSYPLFLQNVNWHSLGFDANQQAVIAQVRQQFLNNVGSLDQNSSSDPANQDVSTAALNPNDPTGLSQWQKAMQTANTQLQDQLGAQGYMAYEQQQYYHWFQPQAVAANAEGKPLAINPGAFTLK